MNNLVMVKPVPLPPLQSKGDRQGMYLLKTKTEQKQKKIFISICWIPIVP